MSEYFIRPIEAREMPMDSYYLKKRLNYSEMSQTIKLNGVKIDSALRSVSTEAISLRQKLDSYKKENEQLRGRNKLLESKLSEYTGYNSQYRELVLHLEDKVRSLQEQNSLQMSESSQLKNELAASRTRENENSKLMSVGARNRSQPKDSIVVKNFKVPSKHNSVFQQSDENIANPNLLTSSESFQLKTVPNYSNSGRGLTVNQEYQYSTPFESLVKAHNRDNFRFR
jgi:hypothetical protein